MQFDHSNLYSWKIIVTVTYPLNVPTQTIPHISTYDDKTNLNGTWILTQGTIIIPTNILLKYVTLYWWWETTFVSDVHPNTENRKQHMRISSTGYILVKFYLYQVSKYTVYWIYNRIKNIVKYCVMDIQSKTKCANMFWKTHHAHYVLHKLQNDCYLFLCIMCTIHILVFKCLWWDISLCRQTILKSNFL